MEVLVFSTHQQLSSAGVGGLGAGALFNLSIKLNADDSILYIITENQIPN